MPVGTAAFAAHAALLAVVVGLARVGLGLVRAGVIGYLLSAPAVAGFTTGAAVLIVSSQLPTLLGVPRRCRATRWSGPCRPSPDPGDWNLATVALGVGVIVVIRGGPPAQPVGCRGC